MIGHEAAADAVREYLRSDPERCMPTCRVGCPCDGGMEDAATGAPDAAQEIVEIVLSTVDQRRCETCGKYISFDVRAAGLSSCPWCSRANETCRCTEEMFCSCGTADSSRQNERPDPAALVGFGSGIDDYLASLYGYTRRAGQSDAVIPVPAALLQEARDSMPDGDARALLTRVIERAKIEGGG